jgi:hypothetical protein
VLLLPDLGERLLYEEFDLSEPWDGPTNKPLLSRIPDPFKPPPIPGLRVEVGHTYYQVFTGDGVFGGPCDMGPRLNAFVHGMSTTLLVVEGADPVPWTKPQDAEYVRKQGKPKVGGLFDPEIHVLMADGSVRTMWKSSFPGEAVISNSDDPPEWLRKMRAKEKASFKGKDVDKK